MNVVFALPVLSLVLLLVLLIARLGDRGALQRSTCQAD